MDCERARELLSDYVEEALADADRAAVAAHLDGCPACAAEAAGLAETITLLSALPAEKAPPELLGRVMDGIARETAGMPGAVKPASLPRFRLPVEAAAAVIILLLVYGIQRGMPVRSALTGSAGGSSHTAAAPLPAPAPTSSPRFAGNGPPAAAAPEKASRAAAERRTPRAQENADRPALEARLEPGAAAPPPDAAKAEIPEPGAVQASVLGMSAARPAPATPVAAPAPALPGVTVLPAAIAERVSTDAAPVEPRMFAAPPSRVLKALPYGREVTLEVAAGERGGIEERIAAAAQRFGGGIHPGIGLRAERVNALLPGAVRVHLPRDSADAFLEALKGLGTIPPDGMPASADFPAGPSAEIVSYTVRIRVR